VGKYALRYSSSNLGSATTVLPSKPPDYVDIQIDEIFFNKEIHTS